MSNIVAASGLTIAAVAARTGVSVPTLRAWEQRHGFPRPERLPGGHRRYSEDEVALISAVVEDRASGRSLESAIERALRDTGSVPDADLDATVFAALRRRHPELTIHLLGRRAMLAISRAIEDECAASGDRAHLAAAFQRADVYRRARARRWRGLARRAAQTIVLADFARSRAAADGVAEIAIPRGAPAEREWSVVCEGPTSAAVLAGWERADGRFEALWSVEPAIVRAAGDVTRALAAQWAPSLSVAAPASRMDTTDALRRGMAIAGRAIADLGAP